MTSVFLDACRRKPTPYTPIWLMRQAGRYQPEYRELRAKVPFVELCKTPELAAQVTLRAVDDLGVDAAIIFADILLILEALRIGFAFTADDGPRIDTPLRSAGQIDALPDDIDATSEMAYVLDALRLVRPALDPKVALIGFAGAPFTLASYAIEGGGSRNYTLTKALMYGDEPTWHRLMEKLTRATQSYLNAQIAAGAEAVQVFDSWVGCLGPSDYRRYVFPHMQALFAGLDRRAPAIHFATGNPALYPLLQKAGGDVIGIDWRVDLGVQWEQLGEVAIMGNLDPAYLLAPLETMKAKADDILAQAGGKAGHIFNLGHGVFPQVSVAQARALVEHVQRASRREGAA